MQCARVGASRSAVALGSGWAWGFGTGSGKSGELSDSSGEGLVKSGISKERGTGRGCSKAFNTYLLSSLSCRIGTHIFVVSARCSIGVLHLQTGSPVLQESTRMVSNTCNVTFSMLPFLCVYC